ncbi:hypothetical protein BJF90_27700 [Pseudonocardia sp. CNS-004]|nr:hypothetical protein BJF90_27700 [Pseudonocardia sp. CNS-004]
MQLWDVPAGRMLLDLSIEVIGPSSIAAAGDRLAVHTKWDTVEIWDLAAGEQLVADLPLADVVSFRGFTADGHLVAVRDRSFDDARIVLYSIDERAEIATLRPSGVGYALVDPTAVRLSGEYGLMPSAVSTDVEHWREQVCRFTPSTPSAAALAAFPPGVDGAAACP